MLVPNEQPQYDGQGYRLALVGEAPGADEDALGKPFMGYSGKLLFGLAAKHGIIREACLVANVCQHRPPGNEIKRFKWEGPEIQEGLAVLRTDLATFNPNLVLCMGNTALRAAKEQYLPDEIEDDPADAEDESTLDLSDEENRSAKREAILAWRGSLFYGFGKYKCLATVHPATVLRQYALKPLLNFDLQRAKEEARNPALILPSRSLRVDMTQEETIVELEKLLTDKPLCAIDIEGGTSWMSCISIARSASDCFIVSFDPNWWGDLYERMWSLMIRYLTSPDHPKILQNALYDLFVLQYAYGIGVRGVVADTMLMHWELYCELKKGLGTQASIYTREPYWKGERHAPDRRTFHTYCCKDSAVTKEIYDVLHKRLGGVELEHCRFNHALLDPILYMECKGIRYDRAKARQRCEDLNVVANRLQWSLNTIVGYPELSKEQWFDTARNAFGQRRLLGCIKTPEDLATYTRTTTLEEATRAAELLALPLTLASQGELSVLCSATAVPADQRGPGINPKSTQQTQHLLYERLKLPIQYKKVGGKKTDTPTTDVLALLTLYKLTSDPTLRLILTIRALRKRQESLASRCDPDSRIRCGYNVVGTKTGRISCYKSPTGSGFNLQTVTKKDRDLFLPDPGWFIFQCDLSGADSWTVAAWCAALGDHTMLEDLRYGLKPAKILCILAERGREVMRWSRDQIKAACKSVNQDDWLYFARKRVMHGSNYGMKGQTMSNQILKDSYKLNGTPIYLSPSDCEREQQAYFLRYPGVLRWHDRIKEQLRTKGYLISANGHRRIFFGRREEHDTFKEACSDEPQNNTTFATNLALHKLWTDEENRGTGNRTILRIQPLHQVHDAIIGQFKHEDTEWAIGKIRSYFANQLTIAGQPITIPFEGSYGESWGNLKEGNI